MRRPVADVRGARKGMLRDVTACARVHEHRVTAEIITRPDGEPVRLTRNGGLKKPMGLYFSVKSGRHMPWESRNELHAFWRAEASSEVLAYWAQPHTLKMTIDGMLSRYTPDREDELACGGVQIIEVKSDFDEKKDPLYTRKLKHAEGIYIGLGYRFQIVTQAEIEAEPSFSAVETIQRHRGVAISQANIEQVQDALADGPEPLGRVQAALGGGPTALAIICGMAVRRMVTVDITCGLAAESLVALVPVGCAGLEIQRSRSIGGRS